MARQRVSIWVRPGSNFEKVNPRQQYPLGTDFFLRYSNPQGKRVWERIHPTGDKPVITLRTAQIRALEREAELEATPTLKPTDTSSGNSERPRATGRKTLTVLRAEFLEQKELTRKKDGTRLDGETISAYKNLLTEFFGVTKAVYPQDLTGMDLRRFMEALKARGLSHRSVCNNYTSIASFLKFCGIDHKTLLPYAERPSADDGVPEAYSEEEVSRFLTACNSERDRLFFEFLLKTGVREMEAVFAEWSDIELDNGVWVFHVHNKPALGFRTKTGKSRKIPLETRLHEQLKLWHEMRPRTGFVFGTASDKPNWHFWRTCKETAARAGLNQEDFWLHKFRATFCTWALRRGVDIRTVQAWAGHSKIEVTERYLAPSDGRYAQDKINAAFAKFG